MGWEKFQATVWEDEGIWLTDDFCKRVVKVYRKQMYPEIPQFWKDTEAAAIAAVQEGGTHHAGAETGGIDYFVDGRFLHCRLPSGRLLAYLDPEVHTKVNWRFSAINKNGGRTVVMFPARRGVPMYHVRRHAQKLAEKQEKRLTNEPPENFLSPHLSFMGRDMYTKKWKRLGTHGGTLVENADQASSRDLLAEAMWRIDQDDRFKLLLSIHDEVIAEAPIGTATLEEFETIMSEVPSWAPGMPIAAEGWIGPRLRK
jgi:DNA polymerase